MPNNDKKVNVLKFTYDYLCQEEKKVKAAIEKLEIDCETVPDSFSEGKNLKTEINELYQRLDKLNQVKQNMQKEFFIQNVI